MTLTPGAGLVLYLGFLAAERAFELARSRRNEARVRARGAIESGASHYPWIVLLHVLWPLGIVAEVLSGLAHPPAWWPFALAAVAIANVLRYAAIRTLGDRWNTRILVVPGEPPLTSGLYRWLSHPNYLGVVIELLAAPLMFGAWRTAALASAANAALLTVRIREENRALRCSMGEPAPPPGPKPSVRR
jgi:methyltransferase